MRYLKGSIAISETFDLPLLLHVRNARYIGQEQLRVLLNYECTSLARRRLAWRVDRLAQAQYLEALEQRVSGDKVYTIARKGLQYLEMLGYGLISITSSMERFVDPFTVRHWMDLMDIRLVFAHSGVLEGWKSEVEVSSENMETGDEYAKDYDAIATLRAGAKFLRQGIEYERTTKGRERYRDLRTQLAGERRLDSVLYFVRDTGRLFSVASELENAHPGILFCSIDSFRQRGVEALFLRSVLEPGASLVELLGLRTSNAPPEANIAV